MRQLKGNIGDEVHRSDHVKDGQGKKEGAVGVLCSVGSWCFNASESRSRSVNL